MTQASLFDDLAAHARVGWIAWSRYQGFHRCTGCGELRTCGAPHLGRRPRWLCVECWSLR